MASRAVTNLLSTVLAGVKCIKEAPGREHECRSLSACVHIEALHVVTCRLLWPQFLHL